jgi:hypothetical protein
MLTAPRDSEGQLPVPGQFPSTSPQPFTEQLRTYAQMISAASGVPATHLGFTTDNPASADAIREANTRLDKRAMKRSSQYDLGIIDLGELCVLWRDGVLPPAGSIRSHWRDPSTPTPAAAADRAIKLIGAGVLPAESDVTLEQLGFSEIDMLRIKADRVEAAGRTALQQIADQLTARANAAAAPTDAPVGVTGGNVDNPGAVSGG